MQAQPCISQLKEWADKNKCAQPTYACTAPAGQPANWHCRAVLLVPQHPPASGYSTFTADGAGKSKQEAKTAAAASLLMQLEQQGLRHMVAAPLGPAAASSTAQQQAPVNNNSCINHLADFLTAYGKGAYQVSYSDALRVPGTPEHRPQWTMDVQLLRVSDTSGSSSDNAPKLTASGSGPNRSGAKHAAAAALLLHPDFASLFAGDANAAAALAKAVAAAEAAAVPVTQAPGAAAVARASSASSADAAAAAAAAPAGPTAPNPKSRLQELVQKAASKKLLGWGGWRLPTYSTKRSFEGQPTMFTSTVTLQGPTGPCSVTGTQPSPTRKEAEQQVAQLMLQQLQPDMLLAQEQQGLAAAQQVSAGAAAGLQAAFQAPQQQQQQVQAREQQQVLQVK